jgi:AcrR family transcriptional regulator
MASTIPVQEDILPEQILQAALQLYLKHGLKKVTMDDVSKVIGKSRSTIYYYFKNRDEIFEAVMEALILEVMEGIEQAVEKADTIEDQIRAFCLAKIKTSESKKAVFRSMEAGMDADEISKHAQTMGAVHMRLIKLETACIKKFLSPAISKGVIRSLKPKEQDMFVFILLSSVRGIKREMAYEDDFSNLKAAVDTLTDMMMMWLND